jgi:hypothetical protein
MTPLLSKIIPVSAGTKVRCIFSPARADDLKPELRAWIGKEGAFEALWIINNDENYEGQWAMRLPQDWNVSTAIWVPECDLTIVHPHSAQGA